MKIKIKNKPECKITKPINNFILLEKPLINKQSLTRAKEGKQRKKLL
jgi:hypothetical protein